jgi:hypothetical protein
LRLSQEWAKTHLWSISKKGVLHFFYYGIIWVEGDGSMSKQLYEVEIKSKALLRENKNGMITYFLGGRKKSIVKNVQALYPQFCDPSDDPIVNIRPITKKEYDERNNGGLIRQKQHLINQPGVIKDGTLEN